jgi:hypothetical protein
MHQDVSEWADGPEHRRTDRPVGMFANTGDELGDRRLCATVCQLIDAAAQASPPNRHLEEPGHAIVHGAHHVRSYSLDIPAQTQARRRQLRFVEFVEQIRELTSLFGDGRKDKLMIDELPLPLRIGTSVTTSDHIFGLLLLPWSSGDLRAARPGALISLIRRRPDMGGFVASP